MWFDDTTVDRLPKYYTFKLDIQPVKTTAIYIYIRHGILKKAIVRFLQIKKCPGNEATGKNNIRRYNK